VRSHAGTPHGSHIPEEWPREAALPAFVCTNCGFWQKFFETPSTCPICGGWGAPGGLASGSAWVLMARCPRAGDAAAGQRELFAPETATD